MYNVFNKENSHFGTYSGKSKTESGPEGSSSIDDTKYKKVWGGYFFISTF